MSSKKKSLSFSTNELISYITATLPPHTRNWIWKSSNEYADAAHGWGCGFRLHGTCFGTSNVLSC